MTPKEKAKELLNTLCYRASLIQNEENKIIILGSGVNVDLVVIAKFMCDEILKQFDGLHKPEYCAFDALGERKFTFEGEYDEHMTGIDMIAYWEAVKDELDKI